MTDRTDGLRKLISTHPHLGAVPWANEQDRWAELLFCGLYQLRKSNPQATRRAVDVIMGLGVGSPERLSSLAGPEDAAARLALAHAGWSANEADAGIELVQALATAVKKKGKVQKLLREAARPFRENIERALENPAIPPRQLQAIVGHWLQNVCNLPLVIADEDLTELASGFGMTVAELHEAADDIDLNVGALDDLAMTRSSSDGEQ